VAGTKRLALACLSGFVAVGIVSCSHPRTGTSPPPSPTTTAAATSYYRAIAARNYRLAFTYLATDATGPDGQRLTWRAFVNLARMMDGEEGPVISFSVAAYQSLIVMTIERKRVGPYHAHLRVNRIGGAWRITSIDRV
jgi:hypothetical protein